MCVVPMIGSPPMPTAEREAEVPQLVHHLVGQRAGLRHQSDPAGLGDVGRDDAGVGLAGADQARAVRADDPGGALGLRVGEEVRGVVHRHALGDHDDQRHRGVDGLDHRALGAGRRHEHDRHVGAGRVHRLLRRSRTPGPTVPSKSMLWPAFFGFTPPTMFVPGGDHPTGVLLALGAGHALHDDLGALVQEDRHGSGPLLRSQLGGAVSSAVHGVHQRDQRVVRLVEDPAPLLDVVPVEAYDERLVGLVAEDLQRAARCRWRPRRTR